MAESLGDLANICRFCLSQDGLIPISQATSSLFTNKDIEHFTGIQIADVDQLSFVMCEGCSKMLENSVAFRSTCISNDVIFKQLFSILVGSVVDEVKDERLPNGSECQFDTEKALATNGCSSITVNESEDTDRMMSAFTSKGSKSILKKKISYDSCTTSQNQTQTTILTSDEKDTQFNGRRRGFKKHLCSMCGKFVSNIPSHYNEQHTKTKLYDCPYCPKKMTSSGNMKQHITLVHEKKITKTCEQCGMAFVHRTTFLTHMMAEHGIGNTYECKECSKTFQQRVSYRRHINRWHKAQKSYTCTICNMTFNLQFKLNRHQRVHTDEQPYPCRICSKRFKFSK